MDDGRGPALGAHVARAPPELFPARGVDAQDVGLRWSRRTAARACLDRRSASGETVEAAKRRQLATPALATVEVVGDQTELGEEGVDARVVGGRRGHRGTGFGRDLVDAQTGHRAAPLLFAGARVVGRVTSASPSRPVRKTVPRTTIGDDWPKGTSRVQAASAAENLTGRFSSGAVPEPLGPRKRGQSSARAAVAAKAVAASAHDNRERRLILRAPLPGTRSWRATPRPGSRRRARIRP